MSVAKLSASYIAGEGYSLDYEPEQNDIVPIMRGVNGMANVVLSAKWWLKDHNIKNADLYEPWGAIWEIRGCVAKRIEPSNF